MLAFVLLFYSQRFCFIIGDLRTFDIPITYTLIYIKIITSKILKNNHKFIQRFPVTSTASYICEYSKESSESILPRSFSLTYWLKFHCPFSLSSNAWWISLYVLHLNFTGLA